jgi:hypothetical protein
MLLVDDIITLPFRGMLWIFDEIVNAAEEELAGEADAIMAQLQQLYSMLDTGRISDAEFDSREAELLDRLETVQQREQLLGDEYYGLEIEAE